MDMIDRLAAALQAWHEQVAEPNARLLALRASDPAAVEFQGLQLDYYLSPPASAEQVEALAQRLGWPLPPGLRDCYLRLGGFESYSDGGFTCPCPNEQGERVDWQAERYDDLFFPAPATWLDLLDPDSPKSGRWAWSGHWHSPGLIDTILFRWHNDRPEFQLDGDDPDYPQLTAANLARINREYCCFAFGGGSYFFFDRQGRFGSARYLQDEFSSFYDDHFLPLLTGEAPLGDFDSILAQWIEIAEVGHSPETDEV
ncbi:SMI1/KNR4 family protein [Chitinimonas lacunae]|uniref:SMI1/KNR4 family protein n=1 Tax=Chitinimonas lacunae TaxID=1963018 RepID=A0ABV8MPZ6_9NEIS